MKADTKLKYLFGGLVFAVSVTVLTRAIPAGALDSSDALAGRPLYSRHCAGCQGRSGTGGGSRAPRAMHSLADCGWMAMKSDATLFLAIKEGSGAIGLLSGMPPFGGALDDEQITELIGYLRSFCARSSKAADWR